MYIRRIRKLTSLKKIRNMKDINIEKLPDNIKMFPGITERIYFQDSETKEFWFHATSVCNVLGYKNVTSALSLHCDDDEKFQEIWNGKATWFVSEAGCYGLAMGAKNEIAKEFKRKLKHDILPKLRSQGMVTVQLPKESLTDYKNRVAELTEQNTILLESNKALQDMNAMRELVFKFAGERITYKKDSYVTMQDATEFFNKKFNSNIDYESMGLYLTEYFKSQRGELTDRVHIKKENYWCDIENASLRKLHCLKAQMKLRYEIGE